MNSEALRLPPDSIVEALIELRFESDDVPEFAAGKLSQLPFPIGFAISRLPGADIPAPIRAQDPTLLYQPILEMRSNDATRIAKVGERSFSWHILGAYPGWAEAQPEFATTIRHVFNQLSRPKIKRIGMRYINIFTRSAHNVSSPGDLSVSVKINNEKLSEPFNLNYTAEDGELKCMIRIASQNFILPKSSDIGALVDIDVFSDHDISNMQSDDVIYRIELCHSFLKDQYIRILNSEMKIQHIGGGDAGDNL